MALKEIAEGIEKAKADYMEGVYAASEKAKAEIKAVNNDETRSSSWMRDETARIVDEYNQARQEAAGAAVEEVLGMYADGLAEAADVLAKQPTAGEAAYLQAFMMKPRITPSDVEQAKQALKGSAVASAAMYARAAENGMRVAGVVPGYIAVAEAHERCQDEDSTLIRTFGAATVSGSGSDYAFSCDSIQAAMRMRAVANEFTSALKAVAEFE